MRPTLAFLRERGRTTMADELEALESTLRRRVVKINDLETDEAVRVLLDVTHQVFRFYPDALADERPPDNVEDE